MSKNKQEEKSKITVPKEVFNSMLEAYKSWDNFMDEFEDFAFSSDEEFLEKMKKARREHKEGSVENLEKLKEKVNV